MSDAFTIQDETEAPAETPLSVVPESLNLSDISRLMSQAAHAQSRIKEIEQTAVMEMQRISHWERSETASDRRLIAEVKAQVEQYALGRLAQLEPGARKGITTAFGRASVIERGPQAVRDDSNSAALLDWAISHDYFRPSEPVTDWKAIKAAGTIRSGQFEVDGLPVPGVIVAEPSVSVTVEFDR